MYDPHDVKRVIALGNSVIVADMVFTSRLSTSGIIIPGADGRSEGIHPRWGKVYAVGPDQKDIRAGEWVCVAHGRWTRGVKIRDETGEHVIRKVDVNDIMLVTDEQPVDETLAKST